MKHLKTYENKNGRTFKEWLIDNPHSLTVKYLDCNYSSLTDLDGIEEFKNLLYLYCNFNYIEELPDLSSFKQLTYFNCSGNNLTKLPDLNVLEKLEVLDCTNNKLTELPDISNLKHLHTLYCSHNRLTKLPDLIDLNLISLSCLYNDLPYHSLVGYYNWHKKEYPWVWNAKKYNL